MIRLYNKQIRILLVTNSLILISGSMIGPIYALFVKDIGGDLLDASYTYVAYAIAAGIATIISGKYADKIKHKEMIVVVGYAIMSVAFFGFTLVDSIWTLLAVQILIGLGEAIYLPALYAIYAKHVDKYKSSSEWGAWEAVDYFTIAIGAVAGGLIVTHLGFNAMFISMGLLSAASAIYIFRLPRRTL